MICFFIVSAENVATTSSTPLKQSLDEVSRLRYELEGSRLSVEELQDAITIERQQCLSWMEKHNKVIYYVQAITPIISSAKILIRYFSYNVKNRKHDSSVIKLIYFDEEIMVTLFWASQIFYKYNLNESNITK